MDWTNSSTTYSSQAGLSPIWYHRSQSSLHRRATQLLEAPLRIPDPQAGYTESSLLQDLREVTSYTGRGQGHVACKVIRRATAWCGRKALAARVEVRSSGESARQWRSISLQTSWRCLLRATIYSTWRRSTLRPGNESRGRIMEWASALVCSR